LADAALGSHFCRKLQKHLQEKPSLPRHYASKLERNMLANFATISGVIEVFHQLFAHLRSTASVLRCRRFSA
jgi:hypothetical protein